MTLQITRNGIAVLLIGCALLPLAYAKDTATAKKSEETEQSNPSATGMADKKKISYGIGVDIGKNFKRLVLDVDLETLNKGINDAYAGKKLELSEDELRSIMSNYQNELKQKQVAALKTIGDANQKAGEVFLADNAKKEGVVSLPSGLQYQILKQGDGQKPAADNVVSCHYRGTLLDGTVFDSSYIAGKPAMFKLGGVIPGWQEALKLMPVGSKWQIFIPPHLAYGQRGAGRDIGPNATLIFEVELVGIQSGETKPAAS